MNYRSWHIGILVVVQIAENSDEEQSKVMSFVNDTILRSQGAD